MSVSGLVRKAVLALAMVHRVPAWTEFRLRHNKHHQPASHHHSSVVCRLNRFLFDDSEVNRESDEKLTVNLPKDDFRTVHAAKILSLRNGDTIRCGIVSCADHDGLVTDEATVQWLPEGKVKKAEPLGNGEPPGTLQISLQGLQPPGDLMRKPPVSIILALPRPLALSRMLPMISQMGVDTLVLTMARKVPKEYFGSHLFRKPELLTERLIEGLCQAGDVRLPKVHVVRHLSNFLGAELDAAFPPDEYARVVAHPQRNVTMKETRMRDVPFTSSTGKRRMVVAVGPEGGWDELEELDRFVNFHGFTQVTMGSRVLRSDCAVVGLLALAHDACDSRS